MQVHRVLQGRLGRQRLSGLPFGLSLCPDLPSETVSVFVVFEGPISAAAVDPRIDARTVAIWEERGCRFPFKRSLPIFQSALVMLSMCHHARCARRIPTASVGDRTSVGASSKTEAVQSCVVAVHGRQRLSLPSTEPCHRGSASSISRPAGAGAQDVLMPLSPT